MTETYVVEIAATGAGGYPKEQVAEIAICRIIGTEFETTYCNGICLDPLDLGKNSLDYLSENHGIEAEDLYTGSPLETVVSEVQKLLFGSECTAYDAGNVFGRYLAYEPWDLTGNATILPSLSSRLPRDLKGPASEEARMLESAYGALCPDDPAQTNGGRRAVHLAQMASCILLELRSRGLYREPRSANSSRCASDPMYMTMYANHMGTANGIVMRRTVKATDATNTTSPTRVRRIERLCPRYN